MDVRVAAYEGFKEAVIRIAAEEVKRAEPMIRSALKERNMSNEPRTEAEDRAHWKPGDDEMMTYIASLSVSASIIADRMEHLCRSIDKLLDEQPKPRSKWKLWR